MHALVKTCTIAGIAVVVVVAIATHDRRASDAVVFAVRGGLLDRSQRQLKPADGQTNNNMAGERAPKEGAHMRHTAATDIRQHQVGG
jgi:hypothetical protein